jgi:hypothetical protein
MTFKPTHIVTIKPGTRYESQHKVMLVSDDELNGPAYDTDEWHSVTNADIELVDGKWMFQGKPFLGTVEQI